MRLFEFDYDLTMMVFFLSPDERVYARYGGRNAESPDAYHSMAGLRYTMESVLREHAAESRRFAPQQSGKPFFIREIAASNGINGCIHCHQAKEVIYEELAREGRWSVAMAFRYPSPDSLGLKLDVDRGNVVAEVLSDSPAAAAGLRTRDVLRTLNDVPIHTFGDTQFALDRAPDEGTIDVSWRRDGRELHGKIELTERWKRSDVSWRPSLRYFNAAARVYGENLSAEEKKSLGIAPDRLAFRQEASVPTQARKAGVQAGDVIIGVDSRVLNMDAYRFLIYVRSNYVKGDVVTLNLLRDGRPLNLQMQLE